MLCGTTTYSKVSNTCGANFERVGPIVESVSA